MLQEASLHRRISAKCLRSISETITPILFHPRNPFDNLLKLNEKLSNQIIHDQAEECKNYEKFLPNHCIRSSTTTSQGVMHTVAFHWTFNLPIPASKSSQAPRRGSQS